MDSPAEGLQLPMGTPLPSLILRQTAVLVQHYHGRAHGQSSRRSPCYQRAPQFNSKAEQTAVLPLHYYEREHGQSSRRSPSYQRVCSLILGQMAVLLLHDGEREHCTTQ